MSPKLKLYTILGILAVIVIGIVGYGAYTGVGPDTAATVGKTVIKKSEAKALKDANVGFSAQKDAVDFLVDEEATKQLSATNDVKITNSDVNKHTENKLGVKVTALKGFALRQARHETLKAELAAAVVGKISGRYLVANFDRYAKSEFTSEPEILALPDDERNKLLAEDQAYAKAKIESLVDQVKNRKLTFEQAADQINNDPRLGKGSYYGSSFAVSGSFTDTDYATSEGIFSIDPLVKAKVAGLKPRAISSVFVGRNLASQNPDKFDDARYLAFTVDSKKAGLTSTQSFEEWYKEQQGKLPVRRFDGGGLVASLISVDEVQAATAGSCSSDRNKWGVRTGRSNDWAGLIVKSVNTNGELLNNINFTISGTDPSDNRNIRYAPDRSDKDPRRNQSLTVETSDNAYCNSYNTYHSFPGYYIFGFGNDSNIGSGWVMDCHTTDGGGSGRPATFRIKINTGTPAGQLPGSWGGINDFNVINGGTKNVTLLWKLNSPPVTNTLKVSFNVGNSTPTDGEFVFFHNSIDDSNHAVPRDFPLKYYEYTLNEDIFATISASQTSFNGEKYMFKEWRDHDKDRNPGPCDGSDSLDCDVEISLGGIQYLVGVYEPAKMATLNVESSTQGGGFSANCVDYVYTPVGSCDPGLNEGTTNWTAQNKGNSIVDYVIAPATLNGQTFKNWEWSGGAGCINDPDPSDPTATECDVEVEADDKVTTIRAIYVPPKDLEVDSVKANGQIHIDTSISLETQSGGGCGDFEELEGICEQPRWKGAWAGLDPAETPNATLTAEDTYDDNGTLYYFAYWQITSDTATDSNGSENCSLSCYRANTIVSLQWGSSVQHATAVANYIVPTYTVNVSSALTNGATEMDGETEITSAEVCSAPCTNTGNQIKMYTKNSPVEDTLNISRGFDLPVRDNQIPPSRYRFSSWSIMGDDSSDCMEDSYCQFVQPVSLSGEDVTTSIVLNYTRLQYQIEIDSDPGNIEFNATPEAIVDPASNPCGSGVSYRGPTPTTITDFSPIELTCGGGDDVTYTLPSTFEDNNKIYTFISFESHVDLVDEDDHPEGCENTTVLTDNATRKVKLHVLDPSDRCSAGFKAIYKFKQFKIIEGR